MPTLSSADPVLETQVFWYRHKWLVFAALILMVLAVAAWGGYRLYAERREDTAAKALAVAKTISDFQKVIAQYPGTPAGESAYLFLAEEQRKDKKFSEANTTLQSFVDKYPQHQMKGTARMAMAGNLESLGKLDEALAIYQRLATDDPQGFIAPAALIAEVPILKAKKQVDEARRACETIMSKYHDSLVSNEAQRQLQLMKRPPSPDPASARHVAVRASPRPPMQHPRLLTAPLAHRSRRPQLRRHRQLDIAGSRDVTDSCASPAAATSPAAGTRRHWTSPAVAPAAATSPAAGLRRQLRLRREPLPRRHPLLLLRPTRRGTAVTAELKTVTNVPVFRRLYPGHSSDQTRLLAQYALKSGGAPPHSKT